MLLPLVVSQVSQSAGRRARGRLGDRVCKTEFSKSSLLLVRRQREDLRAPVSKRAALTNAATRTDELMVAWMYEHTYVLTYVYAVERARG